jgi:YihY family inner membrane protein
MAMFPMMLGALSLLGLAIRDPGTEARFTTLVLQVFPASAQPEIQGALKGIKDSWSWLGVISLAGLVWSASSIFSTMEFALTQIFGTRQRDMLRQRLMGLVMMLVLVAAVVLTVVINAAAAFVPFNGASVVSFFAGAFVMVALLVALYRFVPNRTFRVHEVLPGALLSGVLIEALSFAFPLYARIAGGFNTYGAQFALFFLLATWFYLLSQLVLLGAVFNRFRLGEPSRRGLIASPLHDSKEKPTPVEAIEERQAEPAPPPQPQGSVLHRAARLVRRRTARPAG